MPQIPDSQDVRDINCLINLFNRLEKGEEIALNESDFIILIEYFITENKLNKAISVLSKALKFFPQNYDIKISEAQLLIETGKYQKASQKLKQLYKKNRNELGLIMLIGINYTKQTIFNKATIFFDKAVKIVDKNNKPIILFNVAQDFIQAKRFDIAAHYLTLAYQLNPNDNDIIQELAFCFERNKKYNKAQKLYNIALQKDPFSKITWYNIGVVLAKLQKVDEAIEAFDYAVAIDENFSSPIYNKADLLFQTKKYKQASIEFSNLLKIETSNATAMCQRGICYLKMNNIKKASTDIKESLKMQKKSDLAWFIIAKIYYNNNKIQKAKKTLHNALKNNKIDARYWYLASKIFVKENKRKFADKALKNAIIFAPYTDKYRFALADSKLKQHKTNEAIEILNAGKNFISDKITYLIKLSSLYLLNKDNYKAKIMFNDADKMCDNALKKIISIHPNKKEIKVLIEN